MLDKYKYIYIVKSYILYKEFCDSKNVSEAIGKFFYEYAYRQYKKNPKLSQAIHFSNSVVKYCEIEKLLNIEKIAKDGSAGFVNVEIIKGTLQYFGVKSSKSEALINEWFAKIKYSYRPAELKLKDYWND